ncbi:hypothetical protein BaRGS_00036931, partial [Batillaria attramentaria]
MASEWRRAVFTMYPDVNSKTYFVPPVYFCRVPYEGTQEIIGRQRVLVHKPAITTGAPAMCECIEAPDEMSAARLCLCADQMSDPASPWRMTPAMSEELSAWWHRRMTCTTDPAMSDDVYLDIYDIDIHEEDVETAVKELTDAATTCKEEKGEEKLFVLIDEAKFSYGPAAPRVCQLVSKLSASIPELFLWTATLCIEMTVLFSLISPASGSTNINSSPPPLQYKD